MTVDQRIKFQLGELLFANLVAAAQIEEQQTEIATLKAKVAELEPKADVPEEKGAPPA